GVYTLGVNSDDGFRAYAGTNLVDRFQQGSINLGECDCGRGVADTLYTFNVLQPGLYPLRVTYEQGGGGYAVHLFSKNPDGTKSLLNDSADPNAMKAFRWIAQQRAYIKSIIPAPDLPFGRTYTPNSYLTNGVTIVVGDGKLTKYVGGSAKMLWDGQDVTSSLNTS